ncbi:MAG: hypothetical protein ACMG55_11500 [Microcoleus sp.]
MTSSYYLPQGRVKLFGSPALKPGFSAPALFERLCVSCGPVRGKCWHRKEWTRRFYRHKGCLFDRVCV